MRRMPVLGAAALLLASSRGAHAHAFAQRYDLPLPLWYWLAGAGAAVGLSFALAAVPGLRPRAGPRPPRQGVALPGARFLALSLRGLGVGLLGLLLAAGVVGEQGDWDSNLLPVAVWVIWWVGLTFASALLGDLWSLLDPWRAVADGVAARLPRRVPPLRLPDRIGAWPAVLLFLAFAWAELAWTENAVPRKLAAVVALYSLLAWLGMALLGRAAWRARCDPFARFFALVARFAPFAATRRDGRTALALRPFGAGLLGGPLPSPSETAFVILVLSTVGFDGIAETPPWEAIVGHAMAALYAAGIVHAIGYAAAGSLIKTAGLLATPLLLGAVYGVACAAIGRIVAEPAGLVMRRFVLTLVPIAIAYHLAHYLSYLLVQGQAVLPLLSDPFALGWDLLGTAGREIDLGVIGMRTVWLVAVVAVVAGHAVGVALAHAVARRAYGPRALRSQLPMIVLMIGYTMLSLWILAQPIVSV